MKRALGAMTCFTVLILAMLCSLCAVYVEGAAVARLDMIVSTNRLIAGVNNTVAITLVNNYDDLYDVDAALTLPSPLIISGDNHWRYTVLPKGSSTLISLLMYAPSSAAGNAYSGSLAITYKELGYVYYSSETHTVGFSVHGWVQMIAYGATASPQAVARGSEVAISGNLLNKGNVAAMYTNVTILPSEPLILKSESTAYIGQVDPNSPAPFNLAANIDPSAGEGAYEITFMVSYEDDRYIPHSFTKTVPIQVIREVAARQRQQPNPLEVWLPYVLAASVVAIAITALMYVRRRKTRAKVGLQPKTGPKPKL